jgi:hypothetical protein
MLYCNLYNLINLYKPKREPEMNKDEQRVTCREYLEGYLKENDLEVSSVTLKDVDSMKINGVSRQIKRDVLKEMKQLTEESTMSKKMNSGEQRIIFRKQVEEYLKESGDGYEIGEFEMDFEKDNLDDFEGVELVPLHIKREVIDEMLQDEKLDMLLEITNDLGSDTGKLKKEVNRLSVEVDDIYKLYDFSKEEVDFIHELFKNKDRVFQEGQRELGLKKDDDDEVILIKEKLSDIHKLNDQSTISVGINKEMYGKMKEYGRLLDLSVRQMIHIGMKDLLEKLERDM